MKVITPVPAFDADEGDAARGRMLKFMPSGLRRIGTRQPSPTSPATAPSTLRANSAFQNYLLLFRNKERTFPLTAYAGGGKV
jgi:hypothetical protein